MKSSNYYQRLVQIIGSFAEIILFFSGYFLGQGAFATAAILVMIRIVFKVSVSELMFRRMKAVVREESKQ
jgi:hypothetical protein